MTGIERLKEALEGADYSWINQRVLVRANEGGYRDIRDINTFELHFTLLIEIFAELEQIKEQLKRIEEEPK